jgi:RNA polymerase-binding transcription factor DksA
VDAHEPTALGHAIDDARARAVCQVEALGRALRSIVDGAELTSTDDEHDPEGATVAYERAQTIALLRQAREDLADLDANAARCARDGDVRCVDCGRPIALERVIALPTAHRCISCASSARR